MYVGDPNAPVVGALVTGALVTGEAARGILSRHRVVDGIICRVQKERSHLARVCVLFRSIGDRRQVEVGWM